MAAELEPFITFISTVAGAAVAGGAVTGAGAMWLMNEFKKTRTEFYNALAVVQTKVEGKIDEHEAVDQGRHRDNLEEIKDMAMAVTRVEAQIEYRLPPARR